MTKKNTYCKFYLIRHGQTEWNTKKIMQGHLDSPLTEKGVEQAKTTAEKLNNVKFDHAFSSDLLRAKRTADIIMTDHDLVIKTNHLLREVHLGPFQGKKIDYFQEKLKNALKHRESLSNEQAMRCKVHPELESTEEIATRAIVFLREAALAYLGKNILVVSHAGTIRAVLIKLGFATNKELPHGAIGNASHIIIDSDGVDFFVREVVGIDKKTDL